VFNFYRFLYYKTGSDNGMILAKCVFFVAKMVNI